MKPAADQRPLDRVGSIKAKLALLVGASILAATLVGILGRQSGVPGWITIPVTIAAALAVTQWLARGMIAPLQEMTSAASRMAAGDYSQQVTATSQDEVGTLARAFNTMADDLATADTQRRQLVATVSHELRTPLAAQRALLENLVDGVVSPDDAQLRTALAQSERLSDLVTDLLDLSRMDAGVAPLKLQEVRVLSLLERAVAEAQVGSRPVTYAVSSPADLTVRADPARLAQLVANLLDNASRHSPAGGEVRVTATMGAAAFGVAQGQAAWTLDVTDDGPGIPAERIGEVTRRFGRGADSAGGTGLGLAIAQWVAELHGGRITVEPTAPGERGAHLRVVLPVDPTPRTMHPTQEDPVPQPHPLPAPPPAAASSTPPPMVIPPPMAIPPAPATASQRSDASFLDTSFGAFWPERDKRPRVGVLLASLGVGALAALFLPDRNLGLATFLVLLSAGVVLHAVARHRTDRWSWLTLVLCVALAATTVWRASEWLAVLAILLAGLLLTTALTQAKGLLAMIWGGICWPLSAVRGLPLLGRTLSATSRHGLLWPILRTGALSLVALGIFGGLFASADAVFGTWADAVIPDLAWDSIIFRTFVMVAVSGFVLTASYLAINPPNVNTVHPPAGVPARHRWEWLTPLAVVIALFIGFLVAQASAMWGGHEYLQRTTGLTYAEYVHQGFGQLTVATFFTLVVVGLAMRKARTAEAGDRLLTRVTLGVLCGLTLLVVASALYRMSLYQAAYGFTVLRLFVDAFEVLLGVFIVLMLIGVLRLNGTGLARAGLLATTATLLVLIAMNPASWVASHNIDRYDATGRIDVSYLASLGPDAMPVMAERLPTEMSSCVVWQMGTSRLQGNADLLDWNLGRARAQEAAAPLPEAVDGQCGSYFYSSDYRR